MSELSIMFVCLGNICRSPMAEAILKKKVEDSSIVDNWRIESCGTANYHVGEGADPRTINALQNNGLTLNHRAQQLRNNHFIEFDYLIVMDDSNLADVESLTHNGSCQIHKLRMFDPLNQNADVPDPWFGGIEGFDECFNILNRSCDELLNHLIKKHSS
ncbi:MAG: low molecular weight phosphotyrosine protein phosphatase [Bacteroidia bacterium]